MGTAQHSTFLIADRDGPGRGLNGRLFHECAGDRHVHGSGRTPGTSLIPSSKQLPTARQENPLQLQALDVAARLTETPPAEEKAGSRQRLQVKVHEYKENQDVTDLSQRLVLEKTAKVCLVPFSLSDYKPNAFKLPKSLLDKNSNNEAACKTYKKTEIKKTFREVLTPKMKATTSSETESTLQKSSLDVHTENHRQHMSTSDTGLLSVEMEDSQDGDSDEDTSGLDDFSGLSPYERKRLKNISENANFFASLHLSESAARLREMIKKRQPSESRRKKPKKRENGIGCRRSMRLLNVDPLGVSLPETPTQPTVVEDENPLIPPGPLEMTPENRDDNSELLKGFLQTWAEVNKTSSKNNEKELSSIKSYKANLSGMVISEDTVCKVTKGSIFSMALHPSEIRTLVAAGARSGQVGLWDLTHQPKEDGVYVFQPHSQPVSCLYFSPANPAHILSLSYDGTLRCGDFSKAVFEEVNVNVFTYCLSTVLEAYYMCCGNTKTYSSRYRDVHIYDARHLNPKGSQPLVSLSEHTKSIASAYFSPLTGHRVVTTCADCKLRIFDSSCISSQIPLLTTIRHNTNTGRWLTRFRAVWDPKQEDCIIVGSMAYPRQVEIFHETGKRVHSFLGGECLVSVCSINAMHPTRYILAGGNSSGKIHVFMN
ncbi:PREDICTED: WD repeat-containing protein 76 [Myotis davidii]|uniref:WD repeat-containing protein 76 n=1 Tax=Myotis davidii TaxID=225400 RepID=UPI000766E295|nr:PREDICTED: WD repeat-containing protein 76 [Myotis davidii]